jgi:hypothetical protein
MSLNEMINELESLGINAKEKNDLDMNEIAWLIELLKQDLYELYKSTYNED